MKTFRFLSLTLSLALSACGASQVYYQDANGGVLTLIGPEGTAMEDANERMAAHCGPRGFRIVKRETVVVGQEQYASQTTDYAEREDRARDTSAESVYASASESEQHAYDQGVADTERDPHGQTDTWDTEQGGIQRDAQVGAAASQTTEDEVRVTEGASRTDSVAGTRAVTENRLHYTCGL